MNWIGDLVACAGFMCMVAYFVVLLFDVNTPGDNHHELVHKLLAWGLILLITGSII
jgi:hypothetical protein